MADSESASSGDSNNQGSNDASSENAGQEKDVVSDSVSTTEMTEEIRKVYPDDAEEFQGHHYLLVNDPMNWKQAKKKCEDMKGHLATITSEEEQDFIRRLIEEKGEKYHYWLGATDRKHEGDWEWITGEAWTYQNWEEGQPNNSEYYDQKHGQDYLEIQATYGDNGDKEYMTWTDISEDGVSPDFMEGPEYNSTPYYGFICEWDEILYTIQYNLNGGRQALNQIYTYDGTKKIKLRDARRSGYTFLGWYTDKYYTTKISTISAGSKKNYILYARWKKTSTQ